MVKSQILKYKLTVVDGPEKQTVMVKSGANPVSVIEQNGDIFVYCECLVYEGQQDMPQNYLVVGTGWEYDSDDVFQLVGTVKVGNYVWHVFYAW